MNIGSMLYRAVRFAAQAHEEQKDRSGRPYILHPLSVMRRVVEFGYSETHAVVAVLHDVIEDADMEDQMNVYMSLREEFGAEIGDALEAVTRKKATGESYEEYIERAGQNAIARVVKLADLADNLDPARRRGLTRGLKA